MQMKTIRNVAVVLLVCVLVLSLVNTYRGLNNIEETQEQIEQLREEIKDQLEEQGDQIDAIKEEQEEINSRLQFSEMRVTKYAPLCDRAVAGWDYSGDPSITASGSKVNPGYTCAAGNDLPFGTRVYVDGLGWYKVNDRGGKVGYQHLDLATHSKEQSQQWGSRTRRVIVIKPN